jgi:hypothetical protein
MAKKGKKQRKPASGDVATNRRAGHKFELVEKMEAGIELRGSEVKSLRNGKAQMTDAYRRPRARTTSPSGRASFSCTGPRSSAWSAKRRSAA